MVLFIRCLILSPLLFWYVGRDLYFYYRRKEYKRFEGWGLHLYVGKFGAGKTCSMVYDAYQLACRYPQLHILTNLQLSGFPAHTKILPLVTAQDVLAAPENTLVLIDEIGTIFNSRDFSKSKEAVPKILFQHLCQCRKRRLQIFATTQRWNFLDKQLRDITATVKVTRPHFAHPFTRLCTVRTYDSVEYDLAFSNPMFPLKPLYSDAYIQSDKVRALYDTAQLIDNMLAADYLPEEEILRNRGDLPQQVGQELTKQGARKVKKAAGYY